MRWRIDIESDHVAQFVDELRILGESELANAMGLKSIQAGGGDSEGDASSHAADWHTASPPGIPNGIQVSDLIH